MNDNQINQVLSPTADVKHQPLVLSYGQGLGNFLSLYIGRSILFLITCTSVLSVLLIFYFIIKESLPFLQTVLSLRLLLVSVFFISANAFRVQFLLVCGKTHIYSRIHVIMAMVGLPLVFLLIYSFSYIGAGLATVAIEAGIFTITYFTVKRLKFS